jgi:hypothetical protein
MQGYEETSWSKDRLPQGTTHIHYKERKRPTTKMQAGSSMTVYVAMIMHLFGIVGVDAPTFSPLLQKKKTRV